MSFGLALISGQSTKKEKTETKKIPSNPPPSISTSVQESSSISPLFITTSGATADSVLLSKLDSKTTTAKKSKSTTTTATTKSMATPKIKEYDDIEHQKRNSLIVEKSF